MDMKHESNQTTSAAPNLYLQILRKLDDGSFKCLWFKLDLEREEALLLNWQPEYIDKSIVVALESEIYILGGVRTFAGPDPYEPTDDVHRINTFVTDPNLSRFESAPAVPSKWSWNNNIAAAVMGDKIIFFNSDRGKHIEIFDRSSDQWFRFSTEDMRLPRQMEGWHWNCIVSDHQNNRILMQFFDSDGEGKGLYAFYPESLKWECLSLVKNLFYFSFSVTVNAVLFDTFTRYDQVNCTFIRYELVAMDLDDGCKPMQIVWPSGFDHQFFRKSIQMNVVDLRNGKLCLVSRSHEDLDVPPDYDSDEYYYPVKAFNVFEDDYEKIKCMPVITCMILEVEKQPIPLQPNSERVVRKTKLLVKSFSRLDFKLEDLIFTSVRPDYKVEIMNALVIPRSVSNMEQTAKEHCEEELTYAGRNDNVYLSVLNREQPATEHCSEEPISAARSDNVHLYVPDMEQPTKEHCAEELISGAHNVYLRVSRFITTNETFCYKLDLEAGEKAIPMDCDEFQRITTATPSSQLLSKCPHFEKTLVAYGRVLEEELKLSPNQDVGIPDELQGMLLHWFISDQENNRILIKFKHIGLYAFYPESSNWECLSDGKDIHYPILSVAISNVLYGILAKDQERGRRSVRYELAALDLADCCNPLKIVWPAGFDHQFFRTSKWMDTVDLGNGKLCLVSMCFEHLDGLLDYESDEYYYSGASFNYVGDEEERKYMPVIRCMILEVEKQPPPCPPPQPYMFGSLRRKTKLLVKTFTRLDFKLDDLVYTGIPYAVRIEKVSVVPRE